jgi:hypothetical protein
LGERLLCKQEVIGSIPFTSTRARISRNQPESERSEIRDQIGETAPELGDLIAAGDVRRRPRFGEDQVW